MIGSLLVRITIISFVFTNADDILTIYFLNINVFKKMYTVLYVTNNIGLSREYNFCINLIDLNFALDVLHLNRTNDF